MNLWKSSLLLLFWRTWTISLGIISSVLLARWLNPSDRGNLALYITTISFFAVCIQLGVPEALVKVLNKNKINKNETFNSILYLLTFSIFSSVLLIFITYFSLQLKIGSMCITALVIVSILVTTLLRHLFLAYNHFHKYGLSLAFESTSYTILNCYAFFNLKGSANTAIYIYFINSMIALGVAVLFSCRYIPVWFVLQKPNYIQIKVILRDSVNLFLGGIGSYTSNRVLLYVIGIFHGAQSVGYYQIASSIPNLIENIPQQIGLAVYSKFANSSQTTIPKKIKSGIFVFIMVGMFFVFSIKDQFESLVIYIYGSEYNLAGSAMFILVIASLFRGCNTIIYNAFCGIGHTKYVLTQSIYSLLIISIISVPLVFYNDYVGAAYTQLFAAITVFIYLYRLMVLQCSAR